MERAPTTRSITIARLAVAAGLVALYAWWKPLPATPGWVFPTIAGLFFVAGFVSGTWWSVVLIMGTYAALAFWSVCIYERDPNVSYGDFTPLGYAIIGWLFATFAAVWGAGGVLLWKGLALVWRKRTRPGD